MGRTFITYVIQSPWTNFDPEGLESYGTYEEATSHGFMGQVWQQPNGQYYPVTLGNLPQVFGGNSKTYAPQIATIGVGTVAAVAAPEVSVPAAIAYGGLSGAAAADVGNAVHNAQTGQPLTKNMATTTLQGAAAGATGQAAAEVMAPEAAIAVNAQNKAAGSSTVPTQSAAATRLPQDVAVNPTPPAALPTNRPIGSSPTQNAEAQSQVQTWQQNGYTDVRVNQQQVNAQGQRVGVNRPDLQGTNPSGQRENIEYDTSSSPRGPAHEQRIKANDPQAQVTQKTVD